MKYIPTLAAGLFIAFAAPASAHITLDNGMASWGTYYKAAFRVPHGCDGAATTGISIHVPEGVISVKPMPKAGWKITTVVGKYDKSYTVHGKQVSEGVKTVDWSGGSLADDQFDEFTFLAKLPDDKDIMRIYFPVKQTCGGKTIQWNEVPTPGKSTDDLKTPAPALDLMGGHGDGMEHMHH